MLHACDRHDDLVTLSCGVNQDVTVHGKHNPAAALALVGALSLQATQLGLAKAGYVSKGFTQASLLNQQLCMPA